MYSSFTFQVSNFQKRPAGRSGKEVEYPADRVKESLWLGFSQNGLNHFRGKDAFSGFCVVGLKADILIEL